MVTNTTKTYSYLNRIACEWVGNHKKNFCQMQITLKLRKTNEICILSSNVVSFFVVITVAVIKYSVTIWSISFCIWFGVCYRWHVCACVVASFSFFCLSSASSAWCDCLLCLWRRQPLIVCQHRKRVNMSTINMMWACMICVCVFVFVCL